MGRGEHETTLDITAQEEAAGGILHDQTTQHVSGLHLNEERLQPPDLP